MRRMRRFRGCQLSWHLMVPNIYEDVTDASVNTCYKFKLVFSENTIQYNILYLTKVT